MEFSTRKSESEGINPSRNRLRENHWNYPLIENADGRRDSEVVGFGSHDNEDRAKSEGKISPDKRLRHERNLRSTRSKNCYSNYRTIAGELRV